MKGLSSSGSLLCIDWDVRTLRVVQSRVKRKSVTIDQVLSIAIPRDVRIDDADVMGPFIAEALSKAGISTRRAVVDIPREAVNFFTLTLPAASLDDLAGMVAFQVPKELSFPVDQAVVDFTAPAEAEGETIDVMVSAVRKDALEVYTKIVDAAGLKLQRVGIRPNASQIAVNELLDPTPHDLVLFVDVGPTTTEIDVIHKGRLVFSRAADVTIPETLEQPLTESTIAHLQEGPGLSLVTPTERAPSVLDKVVRELMIEVTRSIEAYRVAKPGAAIEHAVIGGSCDIEEALAEAIQKQFNITAQPYNPAKCFGWDADRGADAGAFAPTLGLALSQAVDPQFTFNFLDPKKAVSKAARRIRKAPLVAAAAAIFIAAGVTFYILAIKPEYERHEVLLAEIGDLRDELEQHGEFQSLVESIEEYERNQIVWIDELHELISALPDQKKIVLSSLDLSQKDHEIKAPFRATGSNIGIETLTALESFRIPDSDKQQFEVKLGASSVKPNEDYGNTGSLEITIVDRKWAGEGSGRGRR